MRSKTGLYACAAAAVLAAFVLASCSAGTGSILDNPRESITGLKGMKENKVLVVGKVVMDPPMPPGAQKLTSNGAEYFRDLVTLVCGASKYDNIEARDLLPYSTLFNGAIECVLGESFYALSSAAPFYISGACVYMDVFTTSGGNRVTINYIPAWYQRYFYVDIRPGDEAVYIGTIKYNRYLSFNVKSVEIVDEYNQEMTRFRRKFGTMKLRKALARTPGTAAD